jgi:endonuclease/exonuclease/phosphatase (EEP) superfamily protein YafD
LKVISWNVLRLTGAAAEDVATLIERHRPDLLLLQEATQHLETLPRLIGGTYFREPLEGRVYGLAMWSPHSLPKPRPFRLPVSQVPGRFPPRVAQIVTFAGVTFANVHLSHGQFLNRYQLLRIASVLSGPAAIIGDYNAVGPITLPGFKDIGPRQPTHSPATILSFRLDRCMARGLRCAQGRVLARGPSDHHPILLELQAAPHPQAVPGRTRVLRANIERLLAAVQDAPVRARLRQRWSRAQHAREHTTRWSA